MRLGRDRALMLFRAMAERVPAYQDFLKKHKINAQDIRDLSAYYASLPRLQAKAIMSQ